MKPMSKISVSPKPYLSPMMVQMIGTYNEDGTPNLMNAAWGGQLDTDLLVLSLDKTHKTVANLLREKAFTLGLPSQKDMVDCDFVGVVSGNKDPKKIEKTNLRFVPAEKVHAPLVESFPVSFECEVFKVFDDEELGFYVVAKVLAIDIDEAYMKEKGKIDVEAMGLFFYSPMENTYREFGKVLGSAFQLGLAKAKEVR